MAWRMASFDFREKQTKSFHSLLSDYTSPIHLCIMQCWVQFNLVRRRLTSAFRNFKSTGYSLVVLACVTGIRWDLLCDQLCTYWIITCTKDGKDVILFSSAFAVLQHHILVSLRLWGVHFEVAWPDISSHNWEKSLNFWRWLCDLHTSWILLSPFLSRC
jgi:hypothetical protein